MTPRCPGQGHPACWRLLVPSHSASTLGVSRDGGRGVPAEPPRMLLPPTWAPGHGLTWVHSRSLLPTAGFPGHLSLAPCQHPISGGPSPPRHPRRSQPHVQRLTGFFCRASCHLTCFHLGRPREWLWQCLRCHRHQRKMQKMKANKSLPSLRLLGECQGVKALTPEVHMEKLHQGELIAEALARSMEIFSLRAQMKLSVSSSSW